MLPSCDVVLSIHTAAAPRLYRFRRLTIFMEKCRDFGPGCANESAANNLILPYPTVSVPPMYLFSSVQYVQYVQYVEVQVTAAGRSYSVS
jgi:hypothetical protein